jgi:hypothetical protein
VSIYSIRQALPATGGVCQTRKEGCRRPAVKVIVRPGRSTQINIAIGDQQIAVDQKAEVGRRIEPAPRRELEAIFVLEVVKMAVGIIVMCRCAENEAVILIELAEQAHTEDIDDLFIHVLRDPGRGHTTRP